MTFMTLGAQTLTVTDVATGCALGQITITVVPGATAGFLVEVTPSSVMTCDSATVTVEAVDACGNITPNYTGAIHFTSSDLLADLPADFTFLSNNHGVATFTVTFNSAGLQTLTVTDKQHPTLTGTETGILVYNCVPVITTLNPPDGPECTAGAFLRVDGHRYRLRAWRGHHFQRHAHRHNVRQHDGGSGDRPSLLL